MNSFTDFISKYGTHAQLLLFVALMVIIWNIENAFGFVIGYKKWKHGFRNALFALTNLPGQLLLGLLFAKTIQWTGSNHFGLLHILPASNAVLVFLMTFILLDFGEYVYHIIMHKVKRLWLFHAVHHTDNVVDVSTTIREHPGENLIRLSFTLLWVFLSGAAFWALVLRQIIQVFSTLFAHMNWRLPEQADKIIGSVFITPNLHQVHHHYQQPYTDCNFGDVLSIWDRLFGTLRKMPAEELVYGVDTYMQKEDTANFKSLVRIPFGKLQHRQMPEVTAESNKKTIHVNTLIHSGCKL